MKLTVPLIEKYDPQDTNPVAATLLIPTSQKKNGAQIT